MTFYFTYTQLLPLIITKLMDLWLITVDSFMISSVAAVPVSVALWLI
jgi:hypothetical protein